jgi:hypothetical protein
MAVHLLTGGDLPPVNPDEPGDLITRTFGWDFTVSTAGTITGGRVYGPTNSAPTTCRIKLFTTGTQTLLAAKTFPSTISTGTWNDLSFDTPVSISTSTTYTMCYYMDGGGHFAFTDNALASNKTNGPITALANMGRFKNAGGVDDFPNSTEDALFFVDVNFESTNSIAVTHAIELDTAQTIGVNRGVGVAVASETDTAFAVGMQLFQNVSHATERDLALAITITGGDQPPAFDEPRDATFWANVLADTLDDGVPTLAFNAAINVWLDRDPTTTPTDAMNTHAGHTLPNWLDLVGVANEIAGTTGLGLDEAMEQIATT